MAQPTAEFEAWLKSSDNMKLSSERSVARLVAEGITDFESLTDFDKKSIQIPEDRQGVNSRNR